MEKKKLMVEVEYARILPRPDLVPKLAAGVIATVFGYGSLKHTEGSWRSLTQQDHVDKARGHLIEIDMSPDREDHLANALCRLYMAVELREEETAYTLDLADLNTTTWRRED